MLLCDCNSRPFSEKRKRPVLRTFDRRCWIALRRFWSGCVTQWHTSRPTPSSGGSGIASADSGNGYRNRMAVVEKHRPASEIRRLIEQILSANLLWRAPRIHGMEPIMRNTSVIFPSPGYLEQVKELSNAHCILLIFDEVITGFRVGLTGAQGNLRVTRSSPCLPRLWPRAFRAAVWRAALT